MPRKIKQPEQSYTYEQVLEAYENMRNMPTKERYKYIHTLNFMAKNALKTEDSEQRIDFYIKIFKEAKDSRAVSLATKKLLSIRGYEKYITIKTKAGVIDVESGLIALGDPKLGYTGEYDDDTVGEAQSAGRFTTVSTGADGGFDIIVRLIDSPEPVASDKEYKFIENSTEPSFINVVSGKVTCGDFWALREIINEGMRCVELNMENGQYKCAFFRKEMGGLFSGYVAVMVKV